MQIVRSSKMSNDITPWENKKMNIAVNKMSLESNAMVENIVVPDVTINFGQDLKTTQVQNRIAQRGKERR